LGAVHVANLDDVEPFVTKDGSQIRELAGRVSLPAEHQSLAEATVPAGAETEEHFHRVTEELYFFTHGSGRVRLGDEVREVTAGDCVVIAPGTPHKLWNTGDGPLKLLCCCAPAYTHDDTVLTGG
jgi:mannose-6-phosphate isomerase-like protein (cupin superfamily)